MNRRDTLLALFALGAAGLPFEAFAQGTGKVWRVGIVSAGSRTRSNHYHAAFLEGMKEYGYAVGRNLILDSRFAEGDPARYPKLVDEVIALKPDALLGSSAGVAIAMKKRTSTIPIVLCTVSDAVGTGLAKSLARSGGNVTGLSLQLHELGAKHVEIVGDLLPRARRIALLTDLVQPQALSESYERVAGTAAAAKGITLTIHRAERPDDLRKALGSLQAQRAEALLVNPSPRFNAMRQQIIQGAAAIRLPSIWWEEECAQDGGLASYGPSFVDAYRRVAYYVERVFKGGKPADLPIEQPTKFFLVVNAKVAKTLGVTIPPPILVRANRVIE